MGDIFIPSNPRDRHLTDIEYQKWEDARDEKKDDFPYIVLTKAQYQILKKAKKGFVKVTDKNRSDVIKLRELVFVKTIVHNDVEFCEIRRRGENYFLYKKDDDIKLRKAALRDWKIAIISAIISAILASVPFYALIVHILNTIYPE